MAISNASKKKLAIWAVALALCGGTLTASAEACFTGKGYGFRSTAGYGWRDGGWGWGAGWGWRGGGWGWRDATTGSTTWSSRFSPGSRNTPRKRRVYKLQRQGIS